MLAKSAPRRLARQAGIPGFPTSPAGAGLPSPAGHPPDRRGSTPAPNSAGTGVHHLLPRPEPGVGPLDLSRRSHAAPPEEDDMDQVLAEGYLYWLRALVNLADRAMADEGVDPDVRDRVVARLYGTGPATGPSSIPSPRRRRNLSRSCRPSTRRDGERAPIPAAGVAALVAAALRRVRAAGVSARRGRPRASVRTLTRGGRCEESAPAAAPGDDRAMRRVVAGDDLVRPPGVLQASLSMGYDKTRSATGCSVRFALDGGWYVRLLCQVLDRAA